MENKKDSRFFKEKIELQVKRLTFQINMIITELTPAKQVYCGYLLFSASAFLRNLAKKIQKTCQITGLTPVLHAP